MENSFFDTPEVSALSTSELNERLNGLVREYNALTADYPYNPDPKKNGWEGTNQFVKVIEYLRVNVFKTVPPISFLEALIKHYNARKQEIVMNEIPSLLHEAGLTEATTEDGIKVSIGKDISLEINGKPWSEANDYEKARVFDWFEENGFEDYVKKTLTFGKGEFKEQIAEAIKASGASFKESNGVHYQSMMKVFRDLVNESPDDLPPEEVIKVKPIEIAKIK